MDKKSRGFTIIELIIVLSVLGIIALIAIPRFLSVTEYAKRDVCEANRAELEHAYEIYLVKNNESDSEVNFNTFLNQWDQEVCPDEGIISRSEGKIKCSIHLDEEVEDSNDSEGSVPFL
ncbi:MAG: prepilin-type N-terminal cleavage/methylation domain-containing protein [Tissierellales bacterium]|nr:prepilin-type N-terminal cleavage/methylation domain-containing protein [Tissierellales bacterium]